MQTGCGGVRLRGLLHYSALNNQFGSETKLAKTANRRQNEIEKKKRAISFLSLLFIFLDRIVTAVAAIVEMVEFMVHNVRHSGKNYALPKVWTVLVSDNFYFGVRLFFFLQGAVSDSNPFFFFKLSKYLRTVH